MTQQDLQNAKDAIREKYLELGGQESLFNEFMATLSQSIDFGLNAEYVETPIDLVGQYFNNRFAGKKEKTTLADTVAAIEQKNDSYFKKYSILDKNFH